MWLQAKWHEYIYVQLMAKLLASLLRRKNLGDLERSAGSSHARPILGPALTCDRGGFSGLEYLGHRHRSWLYTLTSAMFSSQETILHCARAPSAHHVCCIFLYGCLLAVYSVVQCTLMYSFPLGYSQQTDSVYIRIKYYFTTL